jgi:alpha-tubulin suppressor-like RCC1 family protein
VALKRDGSVWVWGENNYGQIGDGSTSSPQTAPVKRLENAEQVEAGGLNSFALKRDGTIWVWGFDMQGGSVNILSPEQLDPGTNWVKIASDQFHLLALKKDGTLWLTGQSAHVTGGSYVTNKTADGRAIGFAQITADTNWIDFVCGMNLFFAKKSGGSWWSMGYNQQGELALGHQNAVATLQRVPLNSSPLAVGSGNQATFMLFEDGSLWTWGFRLGSPKRSVSLKRARQFINELTFKATKKHLFDLNDFVRDITPHKLGSFGAQDIEK